MSRGRTKSTQHHHGCTVCRRRYVCGQEVCQTGPPGRCVQCISGVHSSLNDRWDPRPCCLEQAVLITTRDVLKSFKLAPDESWFKCRTCARTFPCHPSQVRTA